MTGMNTNQAFLALIEGELDTICAKMESDIADAKNAVVQGNAKKEELEVALNEIHENLLQTQADSKEKYKLADAANEFKAAKDAVPAAEEGQHEAIIQKDVLTKAMTNWATPLTAWGLGTRTSKQFHNRVDFCIGRPLFQCPSIITVLATSIQESTW